jgi:hypothetical protein
MPVKRGTEKTMIKRALITFLAILKMNLQIQFKNLISLPVCPWYSSIRVDMLNKLPQCGTNQFNT